MSIEEALLDALLKMTEAILMQTRNPGPNARGILVNFWSQSSCKLGILGQLLGYLGLISEANAHAC